MGWGDGDAGMGMAGGAGPDTGQASGGIAGGHSQGMGGGSAGSGFGDGHGLGGEGSGQDATGIGPGSFGPSGGGQGSYGYGPRGAPIGMISDMGATTLSQMVKAGMNIHNPFDRALAKLGTAIGLPPDRSKVSHFSVMAPFASVVPGALTAMDISQNVSKGMSPLGALGSAALDAFSGNLGSLANLGLDAMGKPSIGETAMGQLGLMDTSPVSEVGVPGQTSVASTSLGPADTATQDYSGDSDGYQPQLASAIPYTVPQSKTQPASTLASIKPFETRVPSYNPYFGDLETYGQDPKMHDFFLNA